MSWMLDSCSTCHKPHTSVVICFTKILVDVFCLFSRINAKYVVEVTLRSPHTFGLDSVQVNSGTNKALYPFVLTLRLLPVLNSLIELHSHCTSDHRGRPQ